jgi:hypothetical protein
MKCSRIVTQFACAFAHPMLRVSAFNCGLLFMSSTVAIAQNVCTVADPTGTPLNVRSTPAGQLLPEVFYNGAEVIVYRTSLDGRGKAWLLVGRPGGNPYGWVFRDYIRCEEALAPKSTNPSLAGSLPDEFLGVWGSVGTAKTDDIQLGSNSTCTGEVARITKKLIDWDALGNCQIDDVESELSHLPHADPSLRPSIKVTLSCDGMYHPLKDTQIWYIFVINGQSFMTQVTVGKLFQTVVLKKCNVPPPPKL